MKTSGLKLSVPVATLAVTCISLLSLIPTTIHAASTDAARVAGDLKVDGIHFSVDNSVIRKLADLSSPWTISSSNIYFLGGNVGIGTLTPAVALDVTGTINASNYTGDGSNLSNVWKPGGNTFGTATTAILGTTDTNNNPLEIWVNNQRAIRIEPNASGPNIALGYSGNIAGGAGIYGATVSGGIGNSASGLYATVSGGQSNSTGSGYSSAIGGGHNNTANGNSGTVGGGYGNTASAGGSTVSGGGLCNATNLNSTVIGGASNTASGSHSTVAGGVNNTAGGDYSFAAGYIAIVRDAATIGNGNTTGDQGTFLWADVNPYSFYSITSNEFAARVTGGVRFVTAVDGAGTPTRTFSIASDGAVTIPVDDYNPSLTLKSTVVNDYARLRLTPSGLSYWDIATGGTDDRFNIYRLGKGDIMSLRPDSGTDLLVMSNGAHLTTGGAWTNASDRNVKTGFAEVDTKAVLEKVAALPITTWSYKTENSDVRHLGPMAQDFHAAFQLGSDDKSITTVDEGGVALAAIQALKEENVALKTSYDALNERLNRLEKLIAVINP
jgi:hypothetical protein